MLLHACSVAVHERYRMTKLELDDHLAAPCHGRACGGVTGGPAVANRPTGKAGRSFILTDPSDSGCAALALITKNIAGVRGGDRARDTSQLIDPDQSQA